MRMHNRTHSCHWMHGERNQRIIVVNKPIHLYNFSLSAIFFWLIHAMVREVPGILVNCHREA